MDKEKFYKMLERFWFPKELWMKYCEAKVVYLDTYNGGEDVATLCYEKECDFPLGSDGLNHGLLFEKSNKSSRRRSASMVL